MYQNIFGFKLFFSFFQKGKIVARTDNIGTVYKQYLAVALVTSVHPSALVNLSFNNSHPSPYYSSLPDIIYCFRPVKFLVFKPSDCQEFFYDWRWSILPFFFWSVIASTVKILRWLFSKFIETRPWENCCRKLLMSSPNRCVFPL